MNADDTPGRRPTALGANDIDSVLMQRARDHSRYVRQVLDTSPELVDEPWQEPFSVEKMQAAIALSPDDAALGTALRRLRQRVILRLLVRDLAGMADLTEVMTTMTALAEICLRHAVTLLARWLHASFGSPIGTQSATRQQLHVIGMGKLGGAELNVSSDIDLIFAYPEEGETSGPTRISNQEYFTRLGRKVISVLHEITPDGQVFRVDMRLRPYGDSGPLVASFDMIEEYFYTQGREWERYAWVKARALTGDRAEELVKMIAPFVFRRHLDFSALGSLRELHSKIRQEVRRRDSADDIKLGPGGIREVEFMAQVFQLIRGGRNTALRARPTLAVLQVLEDQDLLPRTVAGDLREGYVYLRKLEHRLQYLDDRQTHTLPQDADDRARIARSMAAPDWEAFVTQLRSHRERITEHFESIFASHPPGVDAHGLTVVWSTMLPDKEAAAILRHAGFRDGAEMLRRMREFRASGRFARMAASTQARLDQLLPRLLAAAAGCEQPDTAFERLLTIVESIGRRDSYLALLVEYPTALANLARLAAASPWATHYLAQHPILLDELIGAASDSRPDWVALQARLHDNLDETRGNPERQMDIVRHFKHAQTFRLLVQDLAGTLPLETLSDHLSDLAGLVLSEVLPLAWEGVRTRHCATPRFAVIGYGKLGGKELGYASDLDIIFLYDDATTEALENYARLAQRVNTWLSNTTSAGLLYETDLRLRPNGASGLMVSSTQAYREYQLRNAWVWEHQALTRARFVAGDAGVGQRFEEIRQQVLSAPRDRAQLKRDIAGMRQKMLSAHPNPGELFDLKHDHGGIVDVEFTVQFFVLGFAHEYPRLTANIGNLALLIVVGELGLLPQALIVEVRDAYREFRRQQHALRLQGAQFARVPKTSVVAQRNAVRQLWDAVFSHV